MEVNVCAFVCDYRVLLCVMPPTVSVLTPLCRFAEA